MPLRGWRLAVASTGVAVSVGIVTGMIMAGVTVTLGMSLMEPTSLVATLLTGAFFVIVTGMYVRFGLLPGLPVRRIETRPVGRLIASASRRVWYDAVGDDGSRRAKRRELVVWSAACTVCGANLTLTETHSRGLTDPVGLCDENPFSHVYGFNRQTQKGEWMGDADGTVRR